MNTQNPNAPMPAFLKHLSVGTSVTLVLLALAMVWLWFPEATWAKLAGLLLFVLAAPPITTWIVLEVANSVSRGELKHTGKFNP